MKADRDCAHAAAAIRADAGDDHLRRQRPTTWQIAAQATGLSTAMLDRLMIDAGAIVGHGGGWHRRGGERCPIRSGG